MEGAVEGAVAEGGPSAAGEAAAAAASDDEGPPSSTDARDRRLVLEVTRPSVALATASFDSAAANGQIALSNAAELIML